MEMTREATRHAHSFLDCTTAHFRCDPSVGCLHSKNEWRVSHGTEPLGGHGGWCGEQTDSVRAAGKGCSIDDSHHALGVCAVHEAKCLNVLKLVLFNFTHQLHLLGISQTSFCK